MGNPTSGSQSLSPSMALLALGLSCLGVMIAVIVADSSDTAGGLIITFMSGLWIIWLLRHAGAFTPINNLFGSIE